MKYFIGVDGGGTKTEFAISAADAVPIKTITMSGCSYRSIGVSAVTQLLHKGIESLLAATEIAAEECAGCCIGMPCYTENSSMDKILLEGLEKLLVPLPVFVVNDVEVGWAGSLECREGIHIVAGTGSIAFGRGAGGQSARCGGWHEFYGDEGSCYWVGRHAMSLFSKEADGRVPRGPLYELVRQELSLIDDFYFSDVIQEKWAPFRSKVATFQNIACQAAEAGDAAAVELYRNAAYELALMVKAVKEQVTFYTDTVDVSYSGGLFKAGELILQPFRDEIEAMGCTLKMPCHTATEGALLLAINHFNL